MPDKATVLRWLAVKDKAVFRAETFADLRWQYRLMANSGPAELEAAAPKADNWKIRDTSTRTTRYGHREGSLPL